MATFNLSADIREINTYKFEVEATTEEEAKKKLKTYLDDFCPYPYDNNNDGVRCTDREPAMQTEDVVKIYK